MYSLRNVLTQSPEKVKSSLLSVMGCVVIFYATRGYVIDGAFVAAVGIATERTLDLFYVAPVRTSQTLQAIDLGRQLGPQPPTPTPVVTTTPPVPMTPEGNLP